MSLFKNTASQKVRVFAFDATTGLPKSGDSANITASVSKDFGAFADLTDTSATEEDSTKAKGYYLFDISQAETNADDVAITARSSTSNVVVVGAPARIATRPPNAGALSIDSSGRVDVIKVNGTSQTARDLGASVLLSVGTGTGQVNLAAGKVPATLAAADVTGNVAADLQTIKTQTVTCAGGVTVPAATLASTTNITAGTIGTVSGNVNGSVGSISGVTFPTNFADLAITVTTGRVTAGTVSDKTGYALTSGERTSIATALIGTDLSGGQAVASVGYYLVNSSADTPGTTTLLTRVTAAVALASQIPANFTTATFASAGVFSTGALANAPTGGSAPTAAQNAAAVWDLATSGHTTSGTFGAAMNAAGSAGDPWATSLPGSYGAGTAGKIVGDNLNATVSSRSSHSAADVWAVGTRVLTAGTNIALAKGTGVTGFNDIAATDVWAAGTRTITGGTITTVSDKTGYSLTQTFPTNFADLAITSGTGRVTAGTVSDKTGYSLAAAGLDSVTVETGVNARQALALIGAATAGKASGLDTTTAVYYAMGASGTSTTRITATVDADGNRTATTLAVPT